MSLTTASLEVSSRPIPFFSIASVSIGAGTPGAIAPDSIAAISAALRATFARGID